MPRFKDVRRRMKQSAMQSLGVAEKSDDSKFKHEHDVYHGTVASVHSLRKAMSDHAEAMRRSLATASALSLQLAAFHRGSENGDSVRELGKLFAEAEEVSMSSYHRLFDEEVQYVPSEIIAEERDIEERVKHRKQLLLDFDAHKRKFKSAKKEMDDVSAGISHGHKYNMFSSKHSRRNSEGSIAEHLAARKVKLDEADGAVVESTEYLLSRFSELQMHRQTGGLLNSSIAALVACELHVSQFLTRRLSVLQNKFPGTEEFRRKLKVYDMEVEETIRAGVVFEAPRRASPRTREKSDSKSMWKKSFGSSRGHSASSSAGSDSFPLPTKKKKKNKLKNLAGKFGGSSSSGAGRPMAGSISAATIPLPPPPPQRPASFRGAVPSAMVSTKMFGSDLKSLPTKEIVLVGSLRVPRILHECIEYLRDGDRMSTEGIFRVPGATSTVNEMKGEYNTGKSGVLESVPGVDVHDVGTLLKLYLRELPDPVFPSRCYDAILAPIRIDRDAEQPETATGLVDAVKNMHERHRDSIIYLMAFLAEVAALQDQNKMTTTNLARCFAPTVLKPEDEMNMGAMLNDVPVTIATIKCLIENAGAFGFLLGTKSFHLDAAEDDDDGAGSEHSYTASTPIGTPEPRVDLHDHVDLHDPDL